MAFDLDSVLIQDWAVDAQNKGASHIIIVRDGDGELMHLRAYTIMEAALVEQRMVATYRNSKVAAIDLARNLVSQINDLLQQWGNVTTVDAA